MKEVLREKTEQFFVLLVMTSETDAIGISMLLELCDDIKRVADQSEMGTRISACVDFIQANSDSESVLELLRDFAASLTAFVEDREEIVFPHEARQGEVSTSEASENSPTNVVSDLDPSFLAEFIETHTLALEDFESELLKGEKEGYDEVALGSQVKQYLHNLKGDSASVGLREVEHVCHSLETLLTQHPLDAVLPPLLELREWVLQYATGLLKGTPCGRSADQFLKPIENALQPKKAPPSPAKAPARAGGGHAKPPPSTSYKIAIEPALINDFSAETDEHLNGVEGLIVDSDGTYDRNAIDTIFRAVHSIKGGSAYFGLKEMMECSHILENFLSEVREGTRSLDSGLSDLLLTYVDLQKEVLKRAKQAVGADGAMTWTPASQDFLKALERYGQQEESAPPAPGAANTPSPEEVRSSADREHEPSTQVSDRGGEKVAIKNFVKVDTSRLDLLIDSIGEMVIYSSMLIRQCRSILHNDEVVMNTTHQVEKFSRDLQDIGISMRLVPIKGLFQKMSRLVWDTSKKLGKEVTLTIEGEDTELDRNLIEKLADPLMHMVRNALDHGLEGPDERVSSGKGRSGSLKLSAKHSGGGIHICIQDDGRGLNPQKLIAKAVERGIIAEGAVLSEADTFNLIFAPGFSTAAQVTDLSGRGVGMDVVKKNVEALRGRIRIASTVGKGSTFTIELPLTLAMIDGIQVRVGRETYIIPSLSIVEFIKPKPSMFTHTLDRGEAFHFRGRYLPVYRLCNLYGIPSEQSTAHSGAVAVVESNGEQVALAVDEILGECSTVIKNLGALFEEGRGIAGCAIMPDGDVALIIDIHSLIAFARSNYAVSSSVLTSAPEELPTVFN